ncbi:TolC family outer membrane protein [Nioella nitratireducens]|uniref:TolC family outer membrane protein n=1 Tax=Nioella nitratireducens TaxID=1287720 RepID=UPI0008FD6B12|nr:TolC family outer membrane protein [Nioella nitratireducens]
MRATIQRTLAATLIAVGSALTPFVASADTLSDTLSDAYRNSDLLEQNRYLLRLQDEGVAQQVAGLRPVLSFVAQSAYDIPADRQTDSLGLSLSMLLYDGGGTRLSRDAAQEAVLGTRQSLVALEQNVLADAVSAYINLWQDMQVISVRESNVRVITQQLRAAEDRFDVGEATRTDVAQAEATLAQARRALVSAQGQLMIDQSLFELAVGRAPNGLSGPGAVPSLPQTQADAEAIARQSHPQILAMQHTVRANELSVDAARTNYGPELNFEATTGFDPAPSADGEGNTRFTLRLTQPIYAGGRLASAERSALATLHASQSELTQTTRSVVQGIGNAFAQIRIASASIQASQQQIRASRLAFEGVQEEASLGARTTLDVLDAEQTLLEARIGLIEAQTNLYLASYGLMQAMGLLTVEHLGLDVPEYDPTAYYNTVSSAPMRNPTTRGAQLDAVLDRMGRN